MIKPHEKLLMLIQSRSSGPLLYGRVPIPFQPGGRTCLAKFTGGVIAGRGANTEHWRLGNVVSGRHNKE